MQIKADFSAPFSLVSYCMYPNAWLHTSGSFDKPTKNVKLSIKS